MELELGCCKHEAERSIERVLQLYPDIKVVKLFDAYRYMYYYSLGDENLRP